MSRPGVHKRAGWIIHWMAQQGLGPRHALTCTLHTAIAASSRDPPGGTACVYSGRCPCRCKAQGACQRPQAQGKCDIRAAVVWPWTQRLHHLDKRTSLSELRVSDEFADKVAGLSPCSCGWDITQSNRQGPGFEGTYKCSFLSFAYKAT